MNGPYPTDDLRLRLLAGERRFVAFAQDADLRYTWVYRSPALPATALPLGPDAVGRSDAEVLPAPEAAVLTRTKQRVLATGEPARLPLRSRSRGVRHEYELSVEPVRDEAGEVVGVAGTVEDVGDRLRAEEAAARAEAESERRTGRAVEEALRRAGMERSALAAAAEAAAAAAAGLRLCDDPRDLPPRLPVAPGDSGETTRLFRDSLREVRRRTLDAARLAGLPDFKAADLLTAVGELAMNAVMHATGGEARVCCDPAAGAVQVWIEDRGPSPRPIPPVTLDDTNWVHRPRHGLRLALLTADRIHLLTGTSGTVVVAEQWREPPPLEAPEEG